MQKYAPIKVIGRGTWGVVTQCQNTVDGQIVALKTFEGADKSDLVGAEACMQLGSHTKRRGQDA